MERVLPVFIVEVTGNKDDRTEGGTRAAVTREVVPGERFLLVLEGSLIELDVFVIGDGLWVTKFMVEYPLKRLGHL